MIELTRVILLITFIVLFVSGVAALLFPSLRSFQWSAETPFIVVSFGILALLIKK